MTGRYWLGGVTLLASIALATVSVQIVRVALNANSDSEYRDLSFEVGYLTPLETRIEQQENMLASIKDEESRFRIEKNLAKLYRDLGRKSQGQGRLTHAEAAYQKASTYDPDNAAYVASLAELYENAAEAKKSPSEATFLMECAANTWEEAIKASGEDPIYRVRCSRARIRLAKFLWDAGNPVAAKRTLEEARKTMPKNTELASMASKLESTFGR
jgi:tetratricopeptide (TPR) repeat protein